MQMIFQLLNLSPDRDELFFFKLIAPKLCDKVVQLTDSSFCFNDYFKFTLIMKYFAVLGSTDVMRILFDVLIGRMYHMSGNDFFFFYS